MSTTDQTVQLTARLPRDVYDRVAQAATEEKQRPEELAGTLIAEGLDAHATARELFERVSDRYRA